MTLLDKAVAAAFKANRRLSGVAITYARGLSSVEITAIPGQSSQTVETDDIVSEVYTRDFLVLASELVLDGSETTPERGDQVTVGGETLGLLSRAGDPVWRYADQTQQVIRIHTKE